MLGAFALGGWSTAIQAQVLEQGRHIERIDLKGSDWGHGVKTDIEGNFSEIRQSLARIEEKLEGMKR